MKEETFFVRCHGTSSKDIEVSRIVCIVNRSVLLVNAIFRLLNFTFINLMLEIKVKSILLNKLLFFFIAVKHLKIN